MCLHRVFARGYNLPRQRTGAQISQLLENTTPGKCIPAICDTRYGAISGRTARQSVADGDNTSEGFANLQALS